MNKLSIGDVCLYEGERECLIKSIVLTDNGAGDDRLVALIFAKDLVTGSNISATSDKFKILANESYAKTDRMSETDNISLLHYNTIRIETKSGFNFNKLYDSASKRLLIKLDSVLHTFYNVIEHDILPTKTALIISFDTDARILWEKSEQS